MLTLAPAVPMLVLWFRRSRNLVHRWIVGALAVSLVADLVNFWARPGWFVSSVYPVAQLGILYGVLAPRRIALVLLLVTATVAMLAVDTGAWSAPDAALRLTGALAVVALVSHRTDLGLIRPALIVYCGLGACWWVWLPWFTERPEAFLGAWLGYQGCRLTGLGLLTWAVARDQS